MFYFSASMTALITLQIVPGWIKTGREKTYNGVGFVLLP